MSLILLLLYAYRLYLTTFAGGIVEKIYNLGKIKPFEY